MLEVSVVSAVSRAMEVLSSVGPGAIDYSAERSSCGGFCGAADMDVEAASAVMEAMISLPAEHHLALMWRITKDNPRLGENVLKDLTCFVAHHLPSGDRYGRECLFYWVRHWARRDGSSREAAHLYGRSYDTHQRFYREQVAVCLDSWFIAAKGALEPTIDRYYVRYADAA